MVKTMGQLLHFIMTGDQRQGAGPALKVSFAVILFHLVKDENEITRNCYTK